VGSAIQPSLAFDIAGSGDDFAQGMRENALAAMPERGMEEAAGVGAPVSPYESIQSYGVVQSKTVLM
jgi:hypothetical protein